MWQRTIPFKVDIAGVIEIMGSSLYSRIDTPIRELIQNGHDAVMRRRKSDLGYKGRIDVVQDSEKGTLTFSDDGIGLSPDEAEDYLGTLGIGITGLIKSRGTTQQQTAVTGRGDDLIGQFGIGLFSAFMLAENICVETRRVDCEAGVRWEAGTGTEIRISELDREKSGTTVQLKIKPDYLQLVQDEGLLEKVIKEFADFLTIPIYLNQSKARVNVINVAWFNPGSDDDSVALELEGYFNESPLDVIPIRMENPISIAGALYVSPQRTPGFADDATVAVTVRRMVISRRIHDLVPPWASFLRGVLELHQCNPTASREDLVRDSAFSRVQNTLNEYLYKHFEEIAQQQPKRWEAIVQWHRYTLAASALMEKRLRDLLSRSYQWPTSQGPLTFEQILAKSNADPLNESEADQVVWYNADRRQERWVNDLFRDYSAPCVQALRSFEESLLAAMVGDVNSSQIDLRIASASSPNFASGILGIREMEDAGDDWSEFLGETGARVLVASYDELQPVMAFLNERYELSQTFEDLKKEGGIPSGFQRLVDTYFQQSNSDQNEVILNRRHRLVQRALSQGVKSPLASVLRLLVSGALHSAGAKMDRGTHRKQQEDLDWIADALWGRDRD